MSAKFIKIRIDAPTRERFQQKAKAEGVTMTQLIQGWIQDYLAEETVTTDQNSQEKLLWQRLEALEQKVETVTEEPTTANQETEHQLQQYIQYVDQRIDTLESVVINPLQKDLGQVKHSWQALFNQIRELEGKVNQFHTQLEKIQAETKQNLARLTQYIHQKRNPSQDADHG